MSNERFVVAYFRRLGQDWPQYEAAPQIIPTCRNVTAAGRVCAQPCDRRGMHQECCAPGGGLTARHDAELHVLAVMVRRNVDPRPRKEQVIPALSHKVTGQIGQSRMDLVVQDGAERLLVDMTIVSPYAGDASFVGACARRDGFAARRAAIAKRGKYLGPDLVPFAMETGGRLGTEARAFVKRLAHASEEPTKEAMYIYKALSVVLQDGVARQLMQA